jgi:hypothetical protein
VSAGLAALDRRVIDVGLVAAEAIARVAALETTVAELREQYAAVYRLGLEYASMIQQRPRHLKAVPQTGGAS